MKVIEIIKAFIFGIVEGITEWLPISSTGHLILLNEFIKLDVSRKFYSMFEVVIQLGAIMAVVVLFWKDIFPLGQTNNNISAKSQVYIKKDVLILWFKILVACIPAGVIGILFNEKFEDLFYNYQTVAFALIVFGVALLIIESKYKDKSARVNSLSELTFDIVFTIGIFQLIAAIFPGTSRSGATIVGALLLGVSRKVAAEFTFFLAIPVMFGASLLKILQFGLLFSTFEFTILLVGMITAFVSSLLIIKLLMAYIKKHDFKIFGWYRITLGIIVIMYFTLKQ